MTLGDTLIAAQGSMEDIGGIITSVSNVIKHSQRFVLADEVATAGYQLIRSKPASLLEAMPLCRMPYRNMWIEWTGAASVAAGLDAYPSMERDPETRFVNRPTPLRMGCLIEGDATHQRGQMTWAWVHKSGPNVCGLSVNFDWRSEGDVVAWTRRALDAQSNDWLTETLFRKWVAPDLSDQAIMKLMERREDDWKKLARDPVQRRAVMQLLRHEAPWFSRHSEGLLKQVRDWSALVHLVNAWEGDISGEAPFISALMVMFNSRNAVSHTAEPLTKLNAARARRGKPPLLSHIVTRLHLTKARQRAAIAAGLSREAARQHLVRGHFKIRKSGVYWWSPFLRGKAAQPVERKTYVVAN